MQISSAHQGSRCSSTESCVRQRISVALRDIFLPRSQGWIEFLMAARRSSQKNRLKMATFPSSWKNDVVHVIFLNCPMSFFGAYSNLNISKYNHCFVFLLGPFLAKHRNSRCPPSTGTIHLPSSTPLVCCHQVSIGSKYPWTSWFWGEAAETCCKKNLGYDMMNQWVLLGSKKKINMKKGLLMWRYAYKSDKLTKYIADKARILLKQFQE